MLLVRRDSIPTAAEIQAVYDAGTAGNCKICGVPEVPAAALCEADGNIYTNDVCDGAAACGVRRVQLGATTGKDKLSWKWLKGDAFGHAVPGQPDMDTRYALCVYDTIAGAPSLAASIIVDPSSFWQTREPAFRAWALC